VVVTPEEKLIALIRLAIVDYRENYGEDFDIEGIEDALDEIDGLPPRHATERARAKAAWEAGEPERQRKRKERKDAEAFAASERAKWTAEWDANLGGVRDVLENLNALTLAELRSKAGIEP
jgi:hypothetical protein